MGLFDFVKDAGAKLFGGDDAPEPEMITAADSNASQQMDTLRAKQLASRVRDLGLPIEGLSIRVDGETATVSGVAETQGDREKVVLAVGNVAGISQVDDQMTVKEPASVFHTVQSGESLSKISKEHYGDPMKYNLIFEANKPMLEHPDKIYPGQVLRIPALPEATE